MKASKMKAVVCMKYGSPEELVYMDVDKPTPKEKQVLVKIVSASVSSADIKIRSLNEKPIIRLIMKFVFGFKRPNKGILGSQFAGLVEEVGKGVSKFKVGDAVYGINGSALACNAQYVCIKESGVMVKKPENCTFEEVVPVPFGAMTALHILRKGDIKKNDEVLIYGATGSVGTYAVQLAKHFGANVTAVCSKKNFELVKSLGTDRCIDYHTQDFTKEKQKYNVVLDAVWKITPKQGKQALVKGGKYLSVSSPTTETLEKLQYLTELMEQNELKTVIDKTFSLSNTKSAHIYVEAGHKVGNIIINVA